MPRLIEIKTLASRLGKRFIDWLILTTFSIDSRTCGIKFQKLGGKFLIRSHWGQEIARISSLITSKDHLRALKVVFPMAQNYLCRTSTWDLLSSKIIINKPFWIILQKEKLNPSFLTHTFFIQLSRNFLARHLSKLVTANKMTMSWTLLFSSPMALDIESLGEIEKVQGAKATPLPCPPSPPLKPGDEALTKENLASCEICWYHQRRHLRMIFQEDLPPWILMRANGSHLAHLNPAPLSIKCSYLHSHLQ